MSIIHAFGVAVATGVGTKVGEAIGSHIVEQYRAGTLIQTGLYDPGLATLAHAPRRELLRW